MLYLNPPFYEIEGVSLFPDHADPLQFYYLPLMPHFTMIKGPDGKPAPSLSLIKYTGDAGQGGFLNFDCDLSLPPGMLDDIAGELKSAAKLKGTPRLAPVPLVDGSVKLLLLGKESPPPPDPKAPKTTTPPPVDPAAGPAFVLKIQGAAKPSLYGANNACFSVQLDPEGTSVMVQAMQGLLSPIGIVYELDFLALRPGYAVKLTVDWHRVQTHLDQDFSASTLFFSADIDKAVDKLVEDRVIQLDVDTFVPEGEDDTLIADRDRAVAEVRDMIKDAFFTSSIPPPTQAGASDTDKAMKTANSVSQLVATGGASSLGGAFGYKSVDLTRIDQKSLNVNMNERTTVRRQIYPQGHLSGLCSDLIQGGTSLGQYIKEVNLNDPYFQKRTLNVVSRAAFDVEQLQAIAVNVKYGDVQKTVELKSSTDSGAVAWPSVLVSGVMTRDVQYSLECDFSSRLDRTQRPLQLTSALSTTTADTLEIQPSAFLYAYCTVPIVGLGNFWDQYPTVQVDVEYDDDANQIHTQGTYFLTKEVPQQTWQSFIRDTQKRAFQYRLIFRAANDQDISGSWITTDQETIVVRDPRPNKRALQIAPAIDWTKVDRVFVDVSYTEADGTVSGEGHYEFTEEDSATKTFTVALKDPTRRLVAYDITVLNKGGVPVTVPTSYTAQPRLIVLGNMKGHRVVSVHPAAVDFNAKQIKEIDIDLAYVDNLNQLSFADSFTFKTSADRGQFEFDYVDPEQSHYQYRVTTRFKNGLSKAVDWTGSASDELVIPVGT